MLTIILLLLACIASANAEYSVSHKPTDAAALSSLKAKVAAGEIFPERFLTAPAEEGSSAVCGTDTSVFSSLKNVCKMYFTAANGGNYVCSAWMASSTVVGTAGHCVLDNDGWITAATIVCGAYTRYAVSIATTGDYYNHVFTQQGYGVHWADGGTVRLDSALPTSGKYVPYQWRDGIKTCTTRQLSVTVSGYPADNSGGASGCHYDGVQQWRSKGPMKCKAPGAGSGVIEGLLPTQFDSCGGGSGSRVVDSQGIAIGIYVAGPTGSCAGTSNFVSRIIEQPEAAAGVKGVYFTDLVAIV